VFETGQPGNFHSPPELVAYFTFLCRRDLSRVARPTVSKEQSAFPGKFRRRSPTPPGQLRSDSEGRVLWSCRCCIFPLDLEFYFLFSRITRCGSLFASPLSGRR